MKLAAVLICVLGMSVAAHGGSVTIATFADPAAGDGSTPLFSYNASTQMLNGGWALDGLNLQTYAATYVDATFTMTPVSVVNAVLPSETQDGTIIFYSAQGTMLMTIDFDSAQLGYTSFGGTEFMNLNDVTFTGPVLPFPVDMESFAFSFANQELVNGDGSFTATAAFTSSALPEPATLMLLLPAAAVLIRRR